MMASLKWLWSRRWYVVICLAFSAALIAMVVKLWRAGDLADNYQRQLASYDAVVEIHEGAYLAQTAQLDLAETLIREYSPQPTTELAYQAQVKVVTKTRTNLCRWQSYLFPQSVRFRSGPNVPGTALRWH